MTDGITTTNGITMTNGVIECILSRSATKYFDPAATLSDDQIRELAHTASKNFDASDIRQRLETYRARLEAHASRAGTSKT